MTTQHFQTGVLGEDAAVIFLKNQGFRIIDRNFQKRYGEIDIVAKDKNTLVFVEVKTRIGDRFGLPEDAVNKRKVRSLIQSAEYYRLKKKKYDDDIRIDAVAVTLDESNQVIEIKHYKNITG